MKKRILYLQFTDPAAYPPLRRSALLLANADWQVHFASIKVNTTEKMEFAIHPAITSSWWSEPHSRLSRILKYSSYLTWNTLAVYLKKYDWIYASDLWSTLPALWIKRLTRAKILYHEHDTPGPANPPRRIHKARHELALRADLCVLPNASRLQEFKDSTGRSADTLCIWNTPLRSEVSTASIKPASELFWFIFQGSINEQRLPLTLVDAISNIPGTALRIIGYETIGSTGYIQKFMNLAREKRCADRIEYLGVLPTIKQWTEASHAGISFMPMQSSDLNMQHMAGASNKPFEYMAAGLPLLVTQLPEWVEIFEKPGFAISCDPTSTDSLTAAMRRLVENRELARKMGELGREKIRTDWNYDTLFSPVMNRLEQP